MVQIKKQVPPRPPAPAATTTPTHASPTQISKPKPAGPPSIANGTAPKSGSLLAGAIDVKDLKDDYIHMVIYGPNRCGKTTLACQFPKPLVIVSCEPALTGGAKSVKKVEGVKYLHMDSKAQGIDIARELAEDKYFQTVVFDSATSLQDVILKELMGWDDVAIQLNWGSVPEDKYRERSEQTKEVLRYYVNLPKHVIITAKEKDHNSQKGDRTPKLVRGLHVESFFAADLGSATVGWLHDACDYIGRLYLDKEILVKEEEYKVQNKIMKRMVEEETGKIVRRLRTMLHPNFAAGFRSEHPDKVPEYIENPTFDSIYKVIKGE